MADTDAIDANDFAEEVIETGVHRKTVRTSYRIEEVSIHLLMGAATATSTFNKYNSI